VDEKYNIFYYCVKSKDIRSGKVGAYLFHDSKHDYAISPVFDSTIDLFRWAKDSGYEFNPYDKELSIIYQPTRMKKVIKNLYRDTNQNLVYQCPVKFYPDDSKPKIFTETEIEAARNYYLGKNESRKNKLKLQSYTPAQKPDESLKIAADDDFIERIS
jgi:hypothetical protein